ncbi:MAG: NAD(P)H-hydrate dehydratase [Epsilonproteobacteria bacterium]|nr:NAD(P)H-hydrate dehydratase [Campylobacterota bacterium]
MIEIFDEVYTLDKQCYDQGLNEYILMENAARAMAIQIKKLQPKSVCIISGSGNNGADGIALGRMLLGEIDEVCLYLPMELKSQMAHFQYNIYKNYGGKCLEDTTNREFDVYVDAIFGSGLKRDLSPDIQSIIRRLNKKSGFKLACDIPTGIDINGNIQSVAFKADVTVTMGAIKLALLSDNAKDYVGDIVTANLGVSFKNYINKSKYYLLQQSDMHLPIRTKKTSHKGTYGHVGVVVGAKSGAGILASLGALHFGAGLVSSVCLTDVNLPYELMKEHQISDKFNSVVLGMGLGEYEIDYNKLPQKIVIDADMFYKKEVVSLLRDGSVITPHPKEFAHLLGLLGYNYSTEQVQQKRFELALQFSKLYPDVVLLLKGSNPIIAYKQQLYINTLGTPALSKGGSGDVLAGMIGALLAQNYHPLKATITASLAHSIAGDIQPNYALTPIKLIDEISQLI